MGLNITPDRLECLKRRERPNHITDGNLVVFDDDAEIFLRYLGLEECFIEKYKTEPLNVIGEYCYDEHRDMLTLKSPCGKVFEAMSDSFKKFKQ